MRPDVVVTYDEHGGYGHPDHVQTHRVTRRALELVPDDVLPARAFEILTPLTWAREDRAWLREADPAAYRSESWWREHARRRDTSGERPWPLVLLGDDDPYPPSVVDDDLVTHVVRDDAARAVKNDALLAHETQVLVVSEDVHALSNLVATRTTGREGFRRVDPRTWRPVAGHEQRSSLLRLSRRRSGGRPREVGVLVVDAEAQAPPEGHAVGVGGRDLEVDGGHRVLSGHHRGR